MNDWWVDVPGARSLPAARRAAERAQLVALVESPARSRAARPLVLAAGGLALASATGAAVTLFGPEEAANRSEVQCHTTVEAARGVGFAGTGLQLREPVELGGGASAESVREVVGACADLWRQGVLRLGEPNALLPTGQIEEVPPLTACVSVEGIAAVFPTARDVCASLGLRSLEP